MKTLKKKTILKVGVTLIMIALIAMFFIGAGAAEETNGGSCGDNLTWELNDKTLVITGYGDMYDYDNDTKKAPWGTSIESAILPEGLTHIGTYAFYNCSKVEEITIPGSVTTIGDGAFGNTKKLGEIIVDSQNKNFKTIYGTLYEIDNSGNPTRLIRCPPNYFVFTGDDETLKVPFEVDIPETVTTIDDYAFTNCNYLSAVIIPEDVTKIGKQAFCITPIKAEDADDPVYLRCVIIMGDKITTIGDEAFINMGSNSVIYSPNLTSESLSTKYTKENTAIATKTDEMKYKFNIDDIKEGELSFDWFNLPYVDGCEEGFTYNWYDGETHVTTLTENNKTLELKSLPYKYEWNEDVVTFTVVRTERENESLSRDVVNNAVLNRPLNGIFYPFSVIIDEDITKIGEKAFGGFDDNDKKIGFVQLGSIMLPKTLTEVGNDAFRSNNLYLLSEYCVLYCPKDKDYSELLSGKYNDTNTAIAKPTGNPNEYEFSFDASKIEGGLELSIDNQPRNIKAPKTGHTYGWFDESGKLTTVITESPKKLHLEYVPITYKWNNDYSEITFNGEGDLSYDVVFTGLKNRAYKEDIRIVDPFTVIVNDNSNSSGFTSIGDYAFYCSGITSIDIKSQSSKITSIGKKAFKDSGITSLEFLNHLPKLETIGELSISECYSLDPELSVDFPSKNVIIGKQAFHTNHFTSVKLSGVKELGNGAFSTCQSIESFEISGDNLTLIDQLAFNGCKKLSMVNISSKSDDKVDLKENAFAGKVKDRTFPLMYITLSGVKNIVPNQFVSTEKAKKNLKSITLSNIGTIKNKAFEKFTALNKVELIGKFAANTFEGSEIFNGCTSLKYIVSNVLQESGVMDKFKGTVDPVWYITNLKDTETVPDGYYVVVLNGGILDDEFIQQDGYKLPASDKVSKKGYTWNTDYKWYEYDENGDIKIHYDNDPIVKGTPVYANWTPNTYYVEFKSNGGSGIMENQTFTYDEMQALTENTFTRSGYSFIGWNTKSDGSGDSYADKEEVENLTAEKDATVTLYAQWSKNAEPSHPTSFKTEKPSADGTFTFDRAVTVTEATLPGATSAKITNISGDGYYNFDLTAPGFTGNGSMNFKIPLSDLTQKGFTTSDVGLYHQENNEWVLKPTTYLNSDSQYAYYTGTFDSCSPFKVDFEKGAATGSSSSTVTEKQDTQKSSETTKTDSSSTTQKTTTDTTKKTEEKAKSPFPIFGILAGLGAAAVFGLRMRR